MGEYALFGRERIKIGTCEDMYYLRADQARQVQKVSGSLDPADRETQAIIRFRFPWPDEDGTQPGAFENFDRAAGLYGVSVPDAVEHLKVQFVAPGYVVSLPCPEGPSANHGLTIHRNGFPGPVKIVQQAYRNGHLALVCACGGCGARYNLPTLADAEPVIIACRMEAEAKEWTEGAGKWWSAVADRIVAGYEEK